MYIPRLNQMHDRSKALEFMQRYSFATLVTARGNVPIATHLPFVVSEEGEGIVLTAHLARQNEQAAQLEGGTALVIFAEPHAYISPSHYEKEINVPTWNYLSVHAYGTATLITDPTELKVLLETTINTYEAGYRAQWERLPESYINSLIEEIVGFRITVTDLQAKEKLSQNKTRREQETIVEALSQSPESTERQIADYMRRNLSRP